MKLFYSPGACSLASRIALLEAGLPFTAAKVDLGAKTFEGGGDYRPINPKGYVPALQLDDGSVLTESAVILQYIADRKPEAKLAPAAGTMERYRLQEWLNFIASEIHKGFGPLWNPKITPEWRAGVVERLSQRLEWLAGEIAKAPYLTGAGFTVADAYLFTVLNWAGMLKVDLSKWPALQSYIARVAARPAVQAALKAEGLIQ